MTSNQVIEYIKNDKIHELYKIHKRHFDLIDKLSDELIAGDLLDEYELSVNIDKATGVYAILQPIVNALESYMHRVEYNTCNKKLASFDKLRQQDKDIARYEGREAISDIMQWLGDFRAYLDGAQQIIVSAQSRIKRLTVESSAKGIDFKGDKANVPEAKKIKTWEN